MAGLTQIPDTFDAARLQSPWLAFFFMPIEASSYAARVDLLFLALLAVSAFFSGLIALLIVFFSIRYRRGSPANRAQPTYRRDERKRFYLEMFWTIVPLSISLCIYLWGAFLYFNVKVPPKNALEISVVAKQWMWKFQHPDGQREINDLHVPLGEAVRLTMTSQDAIHSLFVPALRIKQDVLPGRYTTTWFKATQPGSYHLFCAQYCGTNHALMRGQVIVMEPAEYQRWLTTSTPNESLATRGEKLFQQMGCSACHEAASNVILTATGIFITGFSSIMTGLNFIITTHKMRAPGMGWFRMPLFVWAIYATSTILVLATPVLAITLLLVGLERLLGLGFFDPRLGGDPLLFQHLFWFYSHPAVYIMVGGAVMGYMGALHCWWPKITGRLYNDWLARIAAVIIFVGFNLTFFPQFLLGYLGMPRRYFAYPPEFQALNVFSTAGASILGVGYVLPLTYLLWSLWSGRAVVLFLLTMALGLAFLGIKAVEYTQHVRERLWPGSPSFDFPAAYAGPGRLYFSLYFTLTGIHAIHLFIGVCVVGILAWMTWRGRFSATHAEPIEITGLYWHFVDIIWIFLFPLLYPIGHR